MWDKDPDRPLDPDISTIIECRDCGCDVDYEEHRGYRCEDCWRKKAKKDLHKRDFGDAMKDIFKPGFMFREQAE